MADLCTNCGAELTAGQRFCRFCGKATGEFAEDGIPTQHMGPAPGTAPHSAATTATPLRSDTSPVCNPQPSYYQPQVPAVPYSQYARPRKGSALGMILGFLSLGVLGIIVLVVMLATRAARNRGDDAPPASSGFAEASGEAALPNGKVRGNETIVTQHFDFPDASNLSINNISGDISIEAWDGPGAELTVTKRGGSTRARAETRIKYKAEGGNLTLTTAPASGRNVTVEYELKLPRTVGRIEITTTDSTIRVSDISGEILVKTANGSIKMSDVIGRIKAETLSGNIDLRDVAGSAVTKTGSGDTHVELARVDEGEPLEFSSMSGSINVRFDSDIDADLSAHTTSGNIDLDPEFGIEVKSGLVGASASGKIGKGGRPLNLKTLSGNIKVSR